MNKITRFTGNGGVMLLGCVALTIGLCLFVLLSACQDDQSTQEQKQSNPVPIFEESLSDLEIRTSALEAANEQLSVGLQSLDGDTAGIKAALENQKLACLAVQETATATESAQQNTAELYKEIKNKLMKLETAQKKSHAVKRISKPDATLPFSVTGINVWGGRYLLAITGAFGYQSAGIGDVIRGWRVVAIDRNRGEVRYEYLATGKVMETRLRD